MRLTPYRVADRLLLDVQPVIPLPEASELTIQLRRRETQARAVRADNRDWTSYAITTPDGVTEPLRKRWAILAMDTALHRAGVTGETLSRVLPRSRFLDLDGTLTGQELTEAFIARYAGADDRPDRWFLERPLHDSARTWSCRKCGAPRPRPRLTGSLRSRLPRGSATNQSTRRLDTAELRPRERARRRVSPS